MLSICFSCKFSIASIFKVHTKQVENPLLFITKEFDIIPTLIPRNRNKILEIATTDLFLALKLVLKMLRGSP